MARHHMTPKGPVPFTPKEEAERDAQEAAFAAEADDRAAINLRIKRNILLVESDWTQIADAPVDAAEWATYRQALRDISSHANWPNLSEADWPVKPQN
jgi:hypothetical protein